MSLSCRTQVIILIFLCWLRMIQLFLEMFHIWMIKIDILYLLDEYLYLLYTFFIVVFSSKVYLLVFSLQELSWYESGVLKYPINVSQCYIIVELFPLFIWVSLLLPLISFHLNFTMPGVNIAAPACLFSICFVACFPSFVLKFLDLLASHFCFDPT